MLKSLNKVQKSAVQSFGNPILIFAGAGSGKTRVLTHKIAYLADENLIPEKNILAVTFTNKAAQAMKTRAANLKKKKDIDATIGTFHSICARILRKDIKHIGYTSDFTIFDVQDQISLSKIILDDMKITKDKLSPQNAKYLLSNYKNKLITPNDLLTKANNHQDKLFAEFYKKYQDSLFENNAADFDDLLLLPIKLFKENPDILKKYQNIWKYVLVDEYQDTNKPQFEFIQCLAKEHRQICVVGDDDQSIYGWRGADIRNILDFEKVFKGCDVFKLEKNYRSTANILDAAYSVVRNNQLRASKQLISDNKNGEKIGILETNDEMEEADALINALEKEIKLEKRNFSDFAVLYRTNSQSRALEDSFRRSSIPYNIIGGIRFYERKEIKDIIGYLSLIINPKDTVSLRRVVNFPPRGIGLKTVDKCFEKAEKKNMELLEVLNEPDDMGIRGKQAEALKRFYGIIMKYNDLLPKLNAGELVRTLVEEIGIKSHYQKNRSPDDSERYDNVLEFLKGLDEFTVRNPDGGLREFLEEVSLLTDLDNWNDQSNRVTLMTVHASKGLEFPVVFISGLEDGLFPLYSSMDIKEKLEEERRLFYVALTRAEDKVYLLYALQRRRPGLEELIGIQSRFVKEIPKEKLEKINFTSALTRRVIGGKPGKHTKTALRRTVVIFDDFKVGDSVEHAIFGIGKVMAISGQGENQRVGIEFKDGLKKKLVVKFANLKKIDT